MPKLSVYVSDDLWERARAVPRPGRDKQNNSQLVQRALEQLVKEQETRRAALASSATLDSARLVTVVARLQAEAKAEYEEGYSAGLELAEALGFDDLRITMNAGGLDDEDGLEWLAQFAPDADEHPAGEFWRKHGEKFGDSSWQGDTRNPDVPDFYWLSEAFCTGASQALRDVWGALRANAWGTAAPPEDSESADDAGQA